MSVATGFVPSVQVDFVDKFSREGKSATNQQNETGMKRLGSDGKFPPKYLTIPSHRLMGIFLLSSCSFCSPDFVIVTETTVFGGNLFCQIRNGGKEKSLSREMSVDSAACSRGVCRSLLANRDGGTHQPLISRTRTQF